MTQMGPSGSRSGSDSRIARFAIASRTVSRCGLHDIVSLRFEALVSTHVRRIPWSSETELISEQTHAANLHAVINNITGRMMCEKTQASMRKSTGRKMSDAKMRGAHGDEHGDEQTR